MVYTNLTTPHRTVRPKNGIPRLPEQSEEMKQTAEIPDPGVAAYSTRVDTDVTEESRNAN